MPALNFNSPTLGSGSTQLNPCGDYALGGPDAMLDVGLYLRDKQQNQSGALNRPFGASKLHPPAEQAQEENTE